MSCSEGVKLVDTNMNNLDAIMNSDRYKIKIKVGRGDISGYHIYNGGIRVIKNKIIYEWDDYIKSKTLTNIEKNSFDMLFRKLLVYHNDEKIFQKHGGCGSFDSDYSLENDSIKIIIKPKRPYKVNEIYDRIINFHNSNFKTNVEKIIESEINSRK